jgi:hypothetical protein
MFAIGEDVIIITAHAHCVNQEAIRDNRKMIFALYRINYFLLKNLFLDRLNVRPYFGL